MTPLDAARILDRLRGVLRPGDHPLNDAGVEAWLEYLEELDAEPATVIARGFERHQDFMPTIAEFENARRQLARRLADERGLPEASTPTPDPAQVERVRSEARALARDLKLVEPRVVPPASVLDRAAPEVRSVLEDLVVQKRAAESRARLAAAGERARAESVEVAS